MSSRSWVQAPHRTHLVVYPSGQRKAYIKARLQKCFGGSNPLTTTGNVPERSKGSDSRSLVLCFVGSNPTITSGSVV